MELDHEIYTSILLSGQREYLVFTFVMIGMFVPNY